MTTILHLLTRLTHCANKTAAGDEKGQGMIEYGLLIALISIAAIVIITGIGGGLVSNFTTVLNAL